MQENHTRGMPLLHHEQCAVPRKQNVSTIISMNSSHIMEDSTVAIQIGNVVLHCPQTICMLGSGVSQTGHGLDSCSPSSSICPRGAFLTMDSIFLMYLLSIWLRCSERINMTAYSKADFRSPVLWHSMTVEVRIGTTSGKIRKCWLKLGYIPRSPMTPRIRT